MKTRLVLTVLVLTRLVWAAAPAAATPQSAEMIEVFRKAPSAPDLRYVDLIIPRQKIGPFTLVMSRRDALQYLGEPDRVFFNDNIYTVKDHPRRCYYVYTAVGVSFLFDGDDLVELTSFSPRFKFPNGIAAGSTENQVEAAFGRDYTLIEGPAQDTLVYDDLGLSFRISKQKRIVWEVVLSRQSSSPPPTPTFEDLLNREVPKLNLAATTLDDLIRLFGEPLAYRWGDRTYSRDRLPQFYVAEFKHRFTALMHRNAIVELGFLQPGFKYSGVLEVGSTLDEALRVLGKPRDTVQGVSRDFKSGVLYVNIAGEEGACYYEKAEWGVRLFFKNFKVSALYLTDPS